MKLSFLCVNIRRNYLLIVVLSLVEFDSFKNFFKKERDLFRFFVFY